MAAERDKPEPLPPPPEELSPEMQAWWDAVKTKNSDLRSAYVRVRDALVDAEAARSRNSNEPPDDFVPLKAAAAYAPHVEYEWLRKRCDSGEIESKQKRKHARIRASISSLLRVVRENWG